MSPLKNIYSDPLSILKLLFLYFCYWVVWFPYIFWILYTLIRYMICKYFLPFHKLSFYSLLPLVCTSFLDLILYFCFGCLCFWCHIQKSRPRAMSWAFSPCSLPGVLWFEVLHLSIFNPFQVQFLYMEYFWHAFQRGFSIPSLSKRGKSACCQVA